MWQFFSSNSKTSGVEQAPEKKFNGENNKDSSVEVTDVDAVGQEQEFAAQEQAGQIGGGPEQAASRAKR